MELAACVGAGPGAVSKDELPAGWCTNGAVGQGEGRRDRGWDGGTGSGIAGQGVRWRDRDCDDRMVEWQVEEAKIEKRWGTWMIIDDSYRDYGMRL